MTTEYLRADANASLITRVFSVADGKGRRRMKCFAVQRKQLAESGQKKVLHFGLLELLLFDGWTEVQDRHLQYIEDFQLRMQV